MKKAMYLTIPPSLPLNTSLHLCAITAQGGVPLPIRARTLGRWDLSSNFGRHRVVPSLFYAVDPRHFTGIHSPHVSCTSTCPHFSLQYSSSSPLLLLSIYLPGSHFIQK